MPGTNPTRTHLDNLSRSLLRLHKALLDGERVSYERVHGRIPTNGAFFQLVLGDAWFAWLRPLSQLMARFDELCEEDEEFKPRGNYRAHGHGARASDPVRSGRGIRQTLL